MGRAIDAFAAQSGCDLHRRGFPFQIDRSRKLLNENHSESDTKRQIKTETERRPPNNDITSVEYYDTVFALAESPVKQGTLWTGSDDGLVHVSTDDGKTWTNVSGKIPEWSTVSIIDPSPHDANTAYVAVDRHRLDDFKPYNSKTNEPRKNHTVIHH